MGSLVVLIGYITLVEPYLTLGNQARLWAAGYAILAGLLVACAPRSGERWVDNKTHAS